MAREPMLVLELPELPVVLLDLSLRVPACVQLSCSWGRASRRRTCLW